MVREGVHMWLFKCKHPAQSLGVQREETSNVDGEFKVTTYHLFCRNCSKPVAITYASIIGGVDAFLSRDLSGGIVYFSPRES